MKPALMFAIAIIVLCAVGLGVFINLRQDSLANSMTIHYIDRSSRTFDPTTNLLDLSIYKLTIWDNSVDKVVSSVTCSARLYIDWAGTKTTHLVIGNLVLYVDNNQKSTMAISNPTTLNKASYQTIISQTVSAGTLAGWAGADGVHTLKIESSMTVKLDFQDGSSNSKSGSAYTTWGFEKVTPAPEPEPEPEPTVYTCDVCGATFSTQSALDAHKAAMHATPEPEPITCPICGGTFSTYDAYEFHMIHVHGGGTDICIYPLRQIDAIIGKLK